MINISRKPAASWSQNQKEAAALLSENVILDIMLPFTGPNWTEEDIHDVAVEVASWVPNTGSPAVVQGEDDEDTPMVIEIIKALQKKGIHCFYPVMHKNNFVKFREYPTVVLIF